MIKGILIRQTIFTGHIVLTFLFVILKVPDHIPFLLGLIFVFLQRSEIPWIPYWVEVTIQFLKPSIKFLRVFHKKKLRICM